jgi:hypothetical protein
LVASKRSSSLALTWFGTEKALEAILGMRVADIFNAIQEWCLCIACDDADLTVEGLMDADYVSRQVLPYVSKARYRHVVCFHQVSNCQISAILPQASVCILPQAINKHHS